MLSSSAARSTSPACSRRSSSSRKISASSRSVSLSTHAGPPSASHAPSTRSRREPRSRFFTSGARTERARSTRFWPSAERWVTSRILSKMSAPPLVYSLPPSSLLPDEGAEAHARFLERRHDLVEVRAVADEDRLAARSLPDDSNDLLRFLLAVVAAVPSHGGARKRRLVRRSGKVRHCARCLVFLRGEHARERLVEPLHEAFLRAAVGAELDRLELHRPEPGVLGLQEERHFGFAKAVDRQHRVADEEQRAAVTLLPAGSQLGEELELRERGVLELVDQDVRDLLVEREQQVARVVDRAERLERAVGELGEVSLAALAEQHLEVRDGGLEKREDRFQRLPLPVVVPLRRHVVDGP